MNRFTFGLLLSIAPVLLWGQIRYETGARTIYLHPDLATELVISRNSIPNAIRQVSDTLFLVDKLTSRKNDLIQRCGGRVYFSNSTDKVDLDSIPEDHFVFYLNTIYVFFKREVTVQEVDSLLNGLINGTNYKFSSDRKKISVTLNKELKELVLINNRFNGDSLVLGAGIETILTVSLE